MSTPALSAPVVIRPIAPGSAAYAAEMLLRHEVLRVPLGLILTAGDTRGEEAQIHLGAYASDDTLVGCVLLQPATPGVYKLRQMAVRPAWQGHGVGRLLVQAAEAHACSQGITAIELHARATAVPFYLHLGYVLTSAAFTEVTIPHHTMVKRLTAIP